MQHADQVAYLERMLRMVRTNTRDDGPGLSYTAVDAYFDPERYRREVALMFRKQPVIVAFSGQLRRPGDFVTHDQTGQPVTGTLLDYLVPTAADLPDYTAGRITTLCPNNPLGAKGIGESGAVGAPAAVVNAVVDALAPFGVEHVDMPVTPEKIWRILEEHTR